MEIEHRARVALEDLQRCTTEKRKKTKKHKENIEEEEAEGQTARANEQKAEKNKTD